MQKKALLFIIAIFLLLLPAAALAESQSVGSNDLIDHAKDYDTKTVVYEGEVLGDILYRGNYAWIAVFDGNNTIGCYVSKEQAEQIGFVGGYGKRGDTVRVEGVFHRACAEHGGDLDIHADTVKTLTSGSVLQMPLSRLVTTLAIVLPLPAALLLFLVWKRRAASHLAKQNSVTNSNKK
jgi:hypothetical protein